MRQRTIRERDGRVLTIRIERPAHRESQDPRIIGISPEGLLHPGFRLVGLVAIDQAADQSDEGLPIAGDQAHGLLEGLDRPGEIAQVAEDLPHGVPDPKLSRPQPGGHLEDFDPAGSVPQAEIQLGEDDRRIELIRLELQRTIKGQPCTAILPQSEQGQSRDRHGLARTGCLVPDGEDRFQARSGRPRRRASRPRAAAARWSPPAAGSDACHQNHPASRVASPTAKASIPRIARTLPGEAMPDRSADAETSETTSLGATACRRSGLRNWLGGVVGPDP